MNAVARILQHAAVGTAVCMAGLLPTPAHAADGEGWKWMVAPYAWAISVDTDLERTQPPEGGISSDLDFDDVLDKFDGAFQMHIEGQGERFGLFTDFTYLGLADDQQTPRFRTASDLDARLFELAAVWSPGDGPHGGLDVFAGLRYIDLDLTVDFDPENPAFNTTTLDAGDSYSDLMLGARYTWGLSDRWDLVLRGDGSFGGTEGTWNTSAVTSYRTTLGAWLFGYRYLAAELETEDSDIDITVHGPVIGYGFIF
jgi:hypothetical protein